MYWASVLFAAITLGVALGLLSFSEVTMLRFLLKLGSEKSGRMLVVDFLLFR